MLDNYEKFKKDVYVLTKIDLNCYKEKQMRRRIDTLINKNGISTYDAYVDLIKKDKENKAFIRQVRDCWGCTSCIKECRHDAIRFFLGADVGGRGASMVVSEKPDISTWTVEKPDGTKITIQVNKKDANKY